MGGGGNLEECGKQKIIGSAYEKGKTETDRG